MRTLGALNMTTRDGIPRFRTTPEFEEKYCTGCKEYWPCDPEFFRKMHGYWAARCRACEAEGIRRSREKSLGRRAVNATVVAALVFGSLSAVASDYCDTVAAMTTAMQMDKERGFTRQQMARIVATAETDETRATGAAIIRLVYVGNEDNGLSPGAMGRLARKACLTTEPNALNAGVAP